MRAFTSTRVTRFARGSATSSSFGNIVLNQEASPHGARASSRVWVSAISTDSFGGIHEALKGWTPEAHGVFTDNLTLARHQLASIFEATASGMGPVAAGTDIIGGLWHMKAIFELSANGEDSCGSMQTIWIFSDMMNETAGFPYACVTRNRARTNDRTRDLHVAASGAELLSYSADCNPVR